jgi:hypothetical protein
MAISPRDSSLRRPRHWILAVLPLLALGVSRAAEPAPLPPFTPWNLAALQRVPVVEWIDHTSQVRSLFFEGEPFKGHKTKVFAFYASPATLGMERAAGTKFPALLLLPGGNGQASGQLVQIYARQGYAAMMIDLGGNWQRDAQTPLERNPDGGPAADEGTRFREPATPDADTWMYHAVADAILARSLLTKVPDLDQAHIGVTGAGWGGYVTCLAAALDPRFAAAAPVYACGFLESRSFWIRHFREMTPEARQKWTQLWDPASYLGSVRATMFFLTGTNNLYYPLDSYMRTYALVPGAKNICVNPRLRHGPLADHRELLTFFDAEFKSGPPSPKIASVEVDKGKLRAEMASKGVLKSATLYYTIGAHSENATRQWVTQPLSTDGPHIRGADAPKDATAWFISVQDGNDVYGSSEVFIK